MNFKQLFYDLYFKLTDIKFWFDCLDDNEKIRIITEIVILLLILLISIVLYFI